MEHHPCPGNPFIGSHTSQLHAVLLLRLVPRLRDPQEALPGRQVRVQSLPAKLGGPVQLPVEDLRGWGHGDRSGAGEAREGRRLRRAA